MMQLDVYFDRKLAGYLQEGDDYLLSFTYSPEWLKSSAAVALAPNLPLQENKHAEEFVLAYFDNLLPDGSIRNFIALAEHISQGNVFGLLERFGGDLAGAINLLPQGKHLRIVSASTGW
jgi:serine/threonine-protein kinase HipA